MDQNVISYLIIMEFLALVNCGLLLYTYKKPTNFYYPAIFVTIPVGILGDLFLALSTNVEEALLANKISYFGASYLPLFVFFGFLSICNIKLSSRIKAILAIFCTLIFILASTAGFSDIYYVKPFYRMVMGVGNFGVEAFGPAHFLFNIFLGFFVVADIFVIIYSASTKKNVSMKTLLLLSLLEIVGIISFFISRAMDSDALVMPAVYIISELIFLTIISLGEEYDLDNAIVNSLQSSNTTGFIYVSQRKKFLGANDQALEMLPELKTHRIDTKLTDSDYTSQTILKWIDKISKDPNKKTFYINVGDKHFKASLHSIDYSSIKNGYLFGIEDDTKTQEYINQLGVSNDQLKESLNNQNMHIHAIQEQMIVNMATMVESRDSNTGGHIRRSSVCVKILVEEILRQNTMELTPEFCEAIVKAAPMHDLGKIAIDDLILRKPGRFNPDEFNTMKTHAEKGAAIVENLLSTIEDPYFVNIAKNVANYHHERYDGSGYPKGLKGDEIPLEARIMAVADVYDALVSRRCYKDKFSFEEAFKIIMDSMGSHFDPKLQDAFIKCSPRLERFYTQE